MKIRESAIPLLVGMVLTAPAFLSGASPGMSHLSRASLRYPTLAVRAPTPSPLPTPSDTLWIARIFDAALPDSSFSGWRPLAFGGDRGETSFEVASVQGRRCLQAEAHAGGSALLKPLELGRDSVSRLRWSWWVEGPVPGGDLTRKEGDDFAARIYVNFRFEPSKAGFLHRLRQRLASRRFGGEAPGKALVYVWGNQAPVGTVSFSAYTDQAALIVVRSGMAGAGSWWTEERDVRVDFREAFGDDPPAIHSVAIMTDADDTRTAASACYGDILFLPPSG